MTEDESDPDDAPDSGGETADSDPDTPANPDGDKPELSADDTADLSNIDVDADDLDPNNDTADADDADGRSDTEDGDGSTAATSVDPAAGEWGEMYVSLVTSTTNSIIEKHGDGHEVDEDHFRSIDLDQHFNDVMEKYRGSADMEPEQALVIGTLIAVGGPVALHTDIVSDLSEEVRG